MCNWWYLVEKVITLLIKWNIHVTKLLLKKNHTIEMLVDKPNNVHGNLVESVLITMLTAFTTSGGVMMWKFGWLTFCLWAVVEQDALMWQEMVTMVEANCLACTVVLLSPFRSTLRGIFSLLYWCMFCWVFFIMVEESSMKVRCVSLGFFSYCNVQGDNQVVMDETSYG